MQLGKKLTLMYDGVNLLWSFCLTPVFCRCAHFHPARDVAHPECALTDQIVA